jgi:hypothetical protein
MYFFIGEKRVASERWKRARDPIGGPAFVE